MATPGGDEQRAAVIETFDVLLEMSQLLNTGLDAQSLGLCVKLCESGVNPEALACLIKEVRAQTASNVPTSVVMERRRLVRQHYVPKSKKKSASDDALSESAGTSAQASKGTPKTMTASEEEASEVVIKDTKPMTVTETEEEETVKDTTPTTMTETEKEATLKDTRLMTMNETEEEETLKYISLSEGTLENPGIALATGLPGPRID